MDKNIRFVVLGVFALIVCAVLIFNTSAASPPPIFEETELPPATSSVYIDLKGEVRKPGVYRVEEGTRLFQAIAMAGGVTDEADLSGINQSKVLHDGRAYTVPTYREEVEEEGLININTADADKLAELPSIGPSTAQAIIDYRQAEGFFKDIDEIVKVSGIGEATFEKIALLITV